LREIYKILPQNPLGGGKHTFTQSPQCQGFLQAAKKVFSIPYRKISGAERSAPIYQGVAHTNHSKRSALMVDIRRRFNRILSIASFDTKNFTQLKNGLALSIPINVLNRAKLKANT